MPSEFQPEIRLLLHNRIAELVPHRIHKIWFLLHGGDEFTLARALNYSNQTYSELIEFGGLISNGRMRNIADIQRAIGIHLGTNTVYKKYDGHNKKQLWIRFEADIWGNNHFDYSDGSDSLTPLFDQSETLQAFFDSRSTHRSSQRDM